MEASEVHFRQGIPRYKARRALTLHKRHEAGEPININEVPAHKLRSWIDNRVIELMSDREFAEWEARQAAEAEATKVEEKTAKPPKAERQAADGQFGPGGVEGADPIIGEPESYIQHLGRGWHNVYHKGPLGEEKRDKVRGAEKAQAALDDLRAVYGVAKGQGVLADQPPSDGERANGPGVDSAPGAVSDGPLGRPGAAGAEPLEGGAPGPDGDPEFFEQFADTTVA